MFNLSKMTVRMGLVVVIALALILGNGYAPSPVLAAAATSPSLGAAASFSVLADLSMSAANPTTISGDLGLSTNLASSKTGTWIEGGAEYFGPLSLAATAHTDALGAFNNLAGQSSSGGWSASVWSPPPGVWTVASDTTFSGTINLNGNSNDVWVFQVGNDMTFSGSVVLAGTAQACHVFWQIGRDATIAVSSTFVGTLIASRNIVVKSGATVDGRMISLNSSLTTDANTITGPVCAHLSFTKLVSPATYSHIGDVLNYTLVATNDGNTNLTNVAISDPGLAITSSTPTQPVATLLPGATLTVTGTRTITTQASLDSGSLNNTATASSTSPVISVSANATATAQQIAHLSLTKTASPTTYSQVGDVITYTLVATNDGNITLTNVSISDPGLNNTGSIPAQPATLAPGATLTVTGTHPITIPDLTSGSFINTAAASGSSGTSATAGKTIFRATSVGGEVSAINMSSVLAPWLGLGLILVLGGSILTVLLLRRRTSR